jgi:hypothetical protein
VPKLTQRVLVSIDLEPDAHGLGLVAGEHVNLFGSNVFVGGTRIGVLPDGIFVDQAKWKAIIADIGELVEYQGQTYPLVRIELVRR